MAKIKGQNIRLYINNKCVAAATNATVHCVLNVEESTTKDTEDDWIPMEPTGQTWDVSSTAYVLAEDDEAAINLEQAYQVGQLVDVAIGNTEGSKNRVAKQMLLEGQAILSDLQIQSNNREQVTYTIRLDGHGDLSEGIQKIADYINSIEGMTFNGIGNFDYQGTLFAVAKATHSYQGTFLFLLAHNGMLTKVNSFTSSVLSMQDYTNYRLDDYYARIKAWAQGTYVMYDDISKGSYNYRLLANTGIIGSPYVTI